SQKTYKGRTRKKRNRQWCIRVEQRFRSGTDGTGFVERNGQPRREPSGVAPRGTGSNASSFQDRHLDPVLLQMPGGREPDDARSDDDGGGGRDHSVRGHARSPLYGRE